MRALAKHDMYFVTHGEGDLFFLPAGWVVCEKTHGLPVKSPLARSSSPGDLFGVRCGVLPGRSASKTMSILNAQLQRLKKGGQGSPALEQALGVLALASGGGAPAQGSGAVDGVSAKAGSQDGAGGERAPEGEPADKIEEKAGDATPALVANPSEEAKEPTKGTQKKSTGSAAAKTTQKTAAA